jgi:hypothetical protein
MGIAKTLAAVGLGLFAALPGTPTYQLNSFGFGSGGTANSGTTTYALEGNTGELGGSGSATTTYTATPGFVPTQQANVPKIATFTNGGGT